MHTENTIKHGIISGIFIFLIGLPFLGSIFDWDLYPQQSENRNLAEFPDLENTPVAMMPDGLENFFNDNFGFRNTLIRRHRKIEKKFFKRGSSKVLKGKTPGWFFYKKAGTVDDFMGNRQLTPEELLIWQEALEERKNYLAEKGVPYIFFVCPDKTMVYPEHLPDSTRNSRGQTRLEQLSKHLRAHSDVEIVYPLPELLAAKSDNLLYLPADTHWNAYGGYIGYRKVVSALQTYYPELEPVPLDDCTLIPMEAKADLATMYTTEDQMMTFDLIKRPETFDITQTICTAYTNSAWVEKMKSDRPTLDTYPDGKRTALIIHDSFAGHGPAALLPTHFNKSYLFWMYVETPDFKQLVDELKPDVVIEMRVERSLRFIPGQGTAGWE
ncbi:MAG TPA: hypothetical protein VLL07_04660 [Pontiella sp.]|nr:hypothetical protein [Pontiella sp.]